MRAGRFLYLHPLLFAAYPVLALLGHNREEVRAVVGLRALLVSVLAAGVLFLALRRLLREDGRAALLTSLAVGMFYAYGHLYNYLEPLNASGLALGRHRLLAPAWLLLFAAGSWAVLRLKGELRPLHHFLFLASALALVFPITQIARYEVRTLQAQAEAQPAGSTFSLSPVANGPAPDIYYIVLDAYSRQDTLRQVYGFDNRPFLQGLKEMGFFVADCSQSNYAQTQLSIASALNFDYLQALDEIFSEENTSRVGLPELIQHSAARQALESLGYSVVAFETGYHWTQIEDADLYLSPRTQLMDSLQTGGLNEFEVLLLRTSAGLILADGTIALPGFLQPDLHAADKIHRERVLYTLEQLERMPELAGPKFVFAHIVSPHKPFVFAADGEQAVDGVDDIAGYRDQVAYLNLRLETLLQKLIAESQVPPVILLQADHGGVDTSPKDRMRILSAYYLPGGNSRGSSRGSSRLYPTLTPVNSFRLVFNTYFGGDFDLLEDTSYFSSYDRPFQFTITPNSGPDCPNLGMRGLPHVQQAPGSEDPGS